MARPAVIFDLDGVLVDSWVARRALAAALAEVGFTGEVPLAGFRVRLGKPLPVILGELGLPGSAAAAFDRHALAMTEAVTAFPGVAALLLRLRRAEVAVGVVTGKARTRSLAVLEHTRLAGAIDALVTPDDAPGKPDPAALRHCLVALGADEALFFVGDTAVDRQTARAAAVPAALAAWGPGRAAAVEPWDLRFETPCALVRHVLGADKVLDTGVAAATLAPSMNSRGDWI